MFQHPVGRRRARLAARAGALGSAVMVAVTAFGMSPSGIPSAAAAAVDGGPLSVVVPSTEPDAGSPLAGGGSATAFTLVPRSGAACAGDTPTDFYTVTSYMVPTRVAPADLTFDSMGPTPSGLEAAFRQPLFDATSTSAFVGAPTLDNAGSPRPKPGGVVNIPAFSLGVFTPGQVPAGTYNVGLACVVPGAGGALVLDRYWNVQIDVTADSGDQPGGFTWTVVEDAGTTTTTTTTEATTTTTAGGSTTTVASDAPTTTQPAGSAGLKAATGAGAADADVYGAASGPRGTPLVQSLTTLPATGTSVLSPVMWAGLLLIFGRMAVLLGRPPRVRTPQP